MVNKDLHKDREREREREIDYHTAVQSVCVVPRLRHQMKANMVNSWVSRSSTDVKTVLFEIRRTA